MKKKGILFSITLLLIATLALVSSVFAWFYWGDNIGDIKFEIIKIDAKVNVYKAIDNNHNGIPNLDNYDNFVYSELIATDTATSNDTVGSVKINVSTSPMYPTQIATYKINVENYSVTKNQLRFVFEGVPQAGLGFLSAFSVRIVEVDGKNLVYHEKKYFADMIDNLTLAKELDISGSLSEENISARDFWLQIEFETYDDLLANVAHPSSIFGSQSDYQEIEGKNILLPMLKVYIEILIES